MMSNYTAVELNASQKEEMFRAAYRQLVMCIRLKNPEDMRERFLNSTFAFHMMKAEGRKNTSPLTQPHNLWIENHQNQLNQAHGEFRAWLRLMLALEGEQDVVDRSIQYLDPEVK